MSDDGLLEQPPAPLASSPASSAAAELGGRRALFAYRLAAGDTAPSRFPAPAPIGDATLSPFRPRSYTFSLHLDTLPPASASASASSVAASASLSPPEPRSLPSSPEQLSSQQTDAAGSAAAALGSAAASASSVSEVAELPSPQSAGSSGVITIAGVPVKFKRCSCKKSKCLKVDAAQTSRLQQGGGRRCIPR